MFYVEMASGGCQVDNKKENVVIDLTEEKREKNRYFLF